MSDIKIFVSHRIDQDSVTIDNPLYVNVRCGAVYDKRSPEEIGGMLGDDTGDNISEKRDSFCELTVMYWAWKNIQADYYGLCHYRRYMSFAPKMPEKNHWGFHIEKYLDNVAIEKYCLLEEIMRNQIEQYDWITTPCEDTNYCADRRHESVYELCKHCPRDFDMHGVDKLIEIVKEQYPQYSLEADEYFSGHLSKFYNCFVMKRELFFEMCEFVFGVLFELEKSLDTKNYNTWKIRMPGFMGEHLIGIFYLHVLKERKYKIRENDLIFFENTQRAKELYPAFDKNNIPVVFSSSDFFAPYAAVFIQSVLDYINDENNYDFIIFESAISEKNKKNLQNMAKEFKNVSIRFYNPKPLLKGIKFYINSASQSEEAYYRILAPFILKNYERAIVMDCDIVAKCDIAELFKVDLEDKLAAIVPDVVWHGYCLGMSPEIMKYQKMNFPLKNPLSYVNTGVIVFDLKSFRESYSLDFVLKFAQSQKFMIQEQDALNLMLEGKIKFLDIEWNMYALVAPCLKDSIDQYAPISEKEAYYKAHKNPKLLHWAAQPKPWAQPDIDYAEEFWAVARRTSFYELILGRMIDIKIGELHLAVYDLQCRAGVFDHRTGARKLADKLLPKGSRRREFAKKLLPKGSRRWNFCKQIYFIIRPKYRPKKQEDDELEDIA